VAIELALSAAAHGDMPSGEKNSDKAGLGIGHAVV